MKRAFTRPEMTRYQQLDGVVAADRLPFIIEEYNTQAQEWLTVAYSTDPLNAEIYTSKHPHRAMRVIWHSEARPVFLNDAAKEMLL